MAKVAKKERVSKRDGRRGISNPKGRKKTKVSYKQQSKNIKGKSTSKVRHYHLRNTKRKTNQRKSSAAMKANKTKKTKLFGHYHRLNEKMNRSRHVHYEEKGQDRSRSRSRKRR